MPVVNQQVMAGDFLAFDYGIRERQYKLIQVKQITSSGIIICGCYELNPDLTIRCCPKWSTGPRKAEIVTDEIKEMVRRDNLISLIVRKASEESLREFSTISLNKIDQVLNAARSIEDK